MGAKYGDLGDHPIMRRRQVDLPGSKVVGQLESPDGRLGRRPHLEFRPVKLDRCTHDDYLLILRELGDFWGTDRARDVHHPMFVHEFGDTAWVVREDGRVIAYLFGFWSQTEPVGYIHLVGVRRSYQRQGIGRWLYEQFEAQARERGCVALKALTPPVNSDSVAFHRRLGFALLGDSHEHDVSVVPDYLGPGLARVVFWKPLTSG